ncbi:hypothetical protein [Citromicrobium bathyomarinum]|uniref:hypothetical protein n=1 Tax=Citromicrobium bathyomarinum TaxID=72174 RepID=UPI001E5D13AC|nr:hypothetical protein [Citromicrobium bathyomarinum]MCD1623482.1 hypothetical protein [Citromicrobium bathyomarinum]
MKNWNADDGKENAPRRVLDLLDAIEGELSRDQWRRTKVLSIFIDDADHSCEVELELAPYVVLLVYYGPDHDDWDDGWDHDTETLDVVGAAGLVAGWVDYYTEMSLAKLADRMVTTQRRLQILSERWSSQGNPVEFVDLKIVRARSFLCHQFIPVIARYRALDDHLNMAIREVQADSLNEILDTYAFDALSPERAEAARTLAGLGAHGWIDKLAINAIRLEHDVADFLKSGKLYRAHHFAPPQLIVFDGHVRASGWDEGSRNFSWRYDTVKVMEKSLPEAILHSLRGQPITDVIEHPILTPELTITRAWVEREYDWQNLMIEFKQPRFLFNRSTGRVWAEDS